MISLSTDPEEKETSGAESIKCNGRGTWQTSDLILIQTMIPHSKVISPFLSEWIGQVRQDTVPEIFNQF